MTNNVKRIIKIFTISLPISFSLFACTSIMANKNGMVLAGHNEDWNEANHFVHFNPPTPNLFGCFYVSNGTSWVLGGINDQGLFLSDNSVSDTGWLPDASKIKYIGNPRLQILQTCATVGDVRHFFETYNISLLKGLRIPVSDGSGASMVVEYAEGKVRFITENQWYQVSTNFLRTTFPGDNVPCNRFSKANQIFRGASELNVPLIHLILRETHQEGTYATKFSCIYDLKKMIIYLYYNYDFEHTIIFDLNEELKQGPHSFSIFGIFMIQ